MSNIIQRQIRRDLDRTGLNPILGALKANAVTVADGTEATFLTAYAQAVSEQRPLFLDRMVTLTTAGSRISDVTIVSDWSGGFTGAGFLQPVSNVQAIGLIHDTQTVAGWKLDLTAQTTMFYSRGEKFVNCTQGLLDLGATGTTRHTYVTLDDPMFVNCGTALNLKQADNCSLNRPTIRNGASATNLGLLLNGAKATRIHDADIEGGRNGIVVSNLGGNSAVTGANWVTGGSFRRIAEEAISLGEGTVTDATNTAILDVFTLSNADGNAACAGTLTAPVLSVDWTLSTVASTTAPTGSNHANKYVLVATGANAGLRLLISGAPGWNKVTLTSRFSCNATITSAQQAAFASGDVIYIVATPVGTVVQRPEIWCYGTGTGIAINGSGTHRVFGARIYGDGSAPTGLKRAPGRNGINVRHLGGTTRRTGALSAVARPFNAYATATLNGNMLFNADASFDNSATGAHASQGEVTLLASYKANRHYGNSAIYQANWADNVGDTSTAIACFDPAGFSNNPTGL